MSAIAFLVSSIAPLPLAKFVVDHWQMVRRNANEIKIPFLFWPSVTAFLEAERAIHQFAASLLS
jgi:hypothetical protein